MDKKNKTGFQPLPLTRDQKEKQIQKILGAVPSASDGINTEERDTQRVTLTMRVPKYYIDDLNHIAKLTGQTKNAIYIDILRNAIKQKLKELIEK